MSNYITTIDGVDYEIEILEDNQVRINDEILTVDFEEVSGQRVFTILVDGKSFEVHVSEDENEWNILIRGTLYQAVVLDEREKRSRDAAGETDDTHGEFVLKSPMPGLVVKIPVKIGDQVSKGAVLLILESMKMQNELKSPRNGMVIELNIKEGDNVEQREPLLVLGPIPDQE